MTPPPSFPPLPPLLLLLPLLFPFLFLLLILFHQLLLIHLLLLPIQFLPQSVKEWEQEQFPHLNSTLICTTQAYTIQ